VLFHLGTAGGTRAYQNPHAAGAVVASMSSRDDGDPPRFVEHTHASPVHNYTDNFADSWMAVDLKAARLVPNHYALRSDAHGSHKLRHWRLEASNDGQAWTILRAHGSDASLRDEPMSVAAWPLDAAAVAGRSFRHFRIVQTGPNSFNGHNHLMCTGIELYGVLTDASR
jgi:hypothetical protein